jgi:DNA replication licensing factor MCM2
MSSSNDNRDRDEEEEEAASSSPAPKRRRTIAEEDDDEDDVDVGDVGGTLAAAEDEDDPSSSSPTAAAPSRSNRAALMERRATERRRQRALQAEVADLIQAEEFLPLDDANPEQPPSEDDDDQADDEVDHDYDYQANAPVEEEEEEGEDLLDNAERDYQRIEALDNYGTEGIDNRDFGNMDMDERRAAEAELAVRDRQSGREGRSAGLYDMALALETEEDDEARRARRGLFRGGEDGREGGLPDDEEGDETDEEDLDGLDPINIEAFDVPLREWIAQERTRREVQRRFRAFLRHYTEDENPMERRRRGKGIYEQKIRAMCASNLSTLQVSYMHIMNAEPSLGLWLNDAPKDMLDVLNEAATRHTLMLFPSYNAIKKEIHVRISDMPILDSLRDLRREHLDHLVKVLGVVTRRSTVYPQLQMAYYRCSSCKMPQGPFRVEGYGHNAAEAYAPEECPRCDFTVYFKLDASMSQYTNYQRVNLQETPGSVPPGRVPRTKEVLLTSDLIDIARPGEEVEVTAIYEHTYDASLTMKSGFPVFSTFLTANHVRKREDASSASNLSEEDVRQIIELSKDPRIGERIVQSIAPSIFGHDNCKMALAMSLFGGVPKNINDKHRIRGDCNVLLLGDPGTAKSQLLKYAENTAPRAVYSTGKGASAVGLTAGVHKDPITKEWTLEGGALVLADKGVCLIDEFDKSKCPTAEAVSRIV